MFGKIFNTFFPMREFLNYLFKKTLGDYILNDLDLNKIEIEISNKAFISLKNIDLNAADINKKHLENFPFLMLEGQIKKFDLSFSMDKISINIDKLNVLLMPIFNKEKTKNLIAKKQTPVKINESLLSNNCENSGQREFTAYAKESTNNEFSLVSSFLNSALSNLEINITNISLSILLYEASNTFQDNPILTFFISELCFRKKKDEDVKLVIENKNFQNLNCYKNDLHNHISCNSNNTAGSVSNNKKGSKNFNNSNNENQGNNNFSKTDNRNNGSRSDSNLIDNSSENASFTNSNETSSNNNSNQLTFLSNKILLIDKIILRIHQQNQNYENEFFEMTNENEEKTNFNFFCNNSSILVFDYKSTGYSVLVDFAEALDPKNKHNEASCNLMNVNIDLRKFEICLTPLQMQILINYFDVFKMISILKQKDLKENFSFKSTKGEKCKNNIKLLKPLKVLKTILSRFSLNLFFEGFNLILLETNYMKDIPKLWSFFQENYNKKIENIYGLESHYSYMEDNFFLAHLAKFKFNFTQDFIANKENLEFSLEKVFLKYIEFLGKKKIIPSNNITHCKLTFNNINGNFLGKSTFNESLNNSNNFANNLNTSKVLFNSQIQRSRNFFNNNNSINNSKIVGNVINQANSNNTIYASNVYYMDKSMNRSSCSIYESVRDYEEAYNSDTSIIKNSLNNTIYQSTLESKDALLERYNLIFESEYLHESHLILELTNNSIADVCCVSIKSYKDYFTLRKGNNQNNNNNKNLMISQQERLSLNNENYSNSENESAADTLNKIPTLNFADYSKQYIEIIFKKINVNFNPLYLYKITKLVFFTQVILNEFLYLIDNNADNSSNKKPNSNKAEETNETNNDSLQAKSFKSESKISPVKNRKGSENSVSFIDKSVFKEDIEENLDGNLLNGEENGRVKGTKSIYFRGCYEKSKQILLIFEEINLKIQTLKRDFYDAKGNCMTNSNTNLLEEFKKYEEYASCLANSKFLSQFIVEYYKANVNPFITNFEKNEFTRSLIGKKQEIKLDKQMNFYKLNKEYFEVNLSNHRILLNFKNEKVDKLLDNFSNYNNLSHLPHDNQIPDSVSYLNSLNKILYDFDLIQINFGVYNILKLKRDMVCSRNSINNSHYFSVDDCNNNNLNQRKIFEFENSYCDKSDNLKRNSVYHNTKAVNDVEQMTSKNNLHFRLSPIAVNQKKTNYPLDANEDEINLGFKKEFCKADEKINAKIESLYNLHNLNLIQNFDFDYLQKNKKSDEAYKEKENEESSARIKIIEKMELSVNLSEDVYLTLEPQIIKKIIPFFDSLLFSLNIHKMITKKQRELYEFYKEVYFVSLNIDNFNEFGFYYRNKNKSDLDRDTEKEEVLSSESKEDDDDDTNKDSNREVNDTIKFSAISLILKNIHLIILRNNSDDYIGQQTKSSQYTNYLVKVSLLNPFVNIISKGACNSSILLSLNDLKIATFKSKHDYFQNPNNSPISLYSFSELDMEAEKENKFLKEIAYEENLILCKGDYLYKSIHNSKNNPNEKADPERDLEKYFKSNQQKNILTLVIKFRETAKNSSVFEKIKKQNSRKSLKNTSNKADEDSIGKNTLETKANKIQNFNDEIISNLQALVETNLIAQSDTSLDIIIISNDAVLSPLTYPNYNFEEIKLIAKEFGIDKEQNKPLDELSKLKTLDIKLNEQINDLLLQTTRTQHGSISIKEYDKAEFRLDVRETSSKFEINLQNNLENLIRNEDLLNSEKDLALGVKAEKKRIKEEAKEKEKIRLEPKQKLINLFSQSNLNIDFNIEINRLSIDAFIENENNNKNNNTNFNSNNNDNKRNTNSFSDVNDRKCESTYQTEDKKATERSNRKKKIRAVLHIEKITHFKEIDLFSKKNSNITKRNLTVSNLNIYLLKNLNHPYAELNILKLNNGRFQEDSIFKYLGFVELLSLNFINLSFTQEISFHYLSHSNSPSEQHKNEILIPRVFNDIAVKLGDISVFACKDTLEACIEAADSLKAKVNKFKDLIDSAENEASENNNNNSNEQLNKETNKDSAKDIQLHLDKKPEFNNEEEMASKIQNSFEINKDKENIIGINANNLIEIPAEENYFDKNNLKNVIFLDDYCNASSKSHLKDIDSDYEKLGYSIHNYSIYRDSDRNSIFDNRMSFDLNLNSTNNNKERKEQTIIFFDLESLKLYIYKGNDFDFKEETDFDEVDNVNRHLIAQSKIRKKTADEKKLSNDEILVILSNSIFTCDANSSNNSKKEARETFKFFYDKQNNSIKIDENFLMQNSLYLNENTNQSNMLNNQNDFNHNLNNNSNHHNQVPNFNNILSTLLNSNLKSNHSYYSKANSESLCYKIENPDISFNKIECFYFCDGGEAKLNKRSNSIQHQNQANNKNNLKSNLNYLESERKLLRKKQNQRDYNNHICINLEYLKSKFTFFRNNEKISMNIFINKFDIEDYVKNSKYKKILSKYVFENFDNMEIYENSKNSKKINKYKYKEDRPLLDFDIDIVKINESFKFEPVRKSSCESAEVRDNLGKKIRKNSDYKIEDKVIIAINKEDNVDNIDIFDLKNKNKKLENDLIHIDGYISPINILVDQATLVFIVEFFLVKDFNGLNNNNNNKNDHAARVNTNASGVNSQKRNLDYKKIKDPLDIKINVEKLKSVEFESKRKIKLKESMEQEQVTKPIRTEYNSTNSTYSATDSNFGVETFSFNEENLSEADLHKKKTFLKNAKISEFFILFSYNAHSVSLSKLTNKEYLELLNFSNISELKIDFKRYDYKGFLPIEDFTKNLLNFWINDLKKEKTKILSNVINSVGFIKPFTTMMSGFFNMIALPYKNYIQDKSLTNGLFSEFKNFVLKFTSQSLFLGEKTFLVIKKIISGAENTNLNKNSYYKKFLYMINDEKKKYEEYYYK